MKCLSTQELIKKITGLYNLCKAVKDEDLLTEDEYIFFNNYRKDFRNKLTHADMAELNRESLKEIIDKSKSIFSIKGFHDEYIIKSKGTLKHSAA